MIRYLAYKVSNNLLSRFVTQRQAPLLRVLGSPVFKERKLFLDLSDENTHLGDRLFFLPWLSALIRDGYWVTLAKQDRLTNDLIVKILGCPPLESGAADSHDLVVFPQPSLLKFYRRYPDALVVNFADTTAHQIISRQLLTSFNQLNSLSLVEEIPLESVNLDPPPAFMVDGEQYFLFSNYINSGRFRKFFVDESKLSARCLSLKEQGFKIAHVGSAGDKLADPSVYPFVDLDLRGELSIQDLISLVRSRNVKGAVTYDNFLMHLTGLYDKQAFVLFRGRFSASNYRHHMQFVNNTFFKNENSLVYL